jgi:hypothetical protein
VKKRIALLIILTLLFGTLSARLGPDVSVTADGKTLRWEEGSRDYFVMFKSLIEDRFGNAGQPGTNPQADSCIDYNTGSTFKLESHHIPDDAYVEAAYLIWTAAQNPDNINGQTDNWVTLSFKSGDNSISLERTVTSDISGTLNTPGSFEYEAFKGFDDQSNTETGVFTYRVEVTDFMQEIIEKGREAGSSYDGYSLLGDYNVKNMDCYNHDAYVQRSVMVGDWVLFFVYTSEEIQFPKKIYVYNGLQEYHHGFEDINVTGFELPDEAEMRLTMVVHEGDPGLVNTSSFTGGSMNPEALRLSGASTQDWLYLTNVCNPMMAQMNFNYVEVFNMVSSMYGWEDNWQSTPYCVGGIPPNYNTSELEFGVDVDTFVISALDPLFEPHLIPGDDHLWLQVSANQDLIYTNLLILSIDTKRPKFDIPPNQDTPDGREKNFCTCSTQEDAVCDNRPFYFTIKVENWGDNIANNVTVEDALPPLVDYIPGTTEMLVTKGGVTGDWEKIEDDNGMFPLKNPVQVAESMTYCSEVTYECEDSILIRFKVKPVDTIQKHDVIQNTAVITDSSGIKYYSNSSVPLKLRLGNCPSITECPEPTKEQCGGLGGDSEKECTKDDECDSGSCVDGKCVTGGDFDLTENSEITFAEGINSPRSEGTPIIIPNPSKDLVVAQFTLLATGDKAKSFEFLGANFAVTKNDNATSLTNFRLIHDKEGTGVVDKEDKVIATVENMSAGSANLTVLNESDRIFSADKLHYFLVVLDSEHSTDITSNIKFNVELSGPESILVKDKGKATVKGSNITFSEFRFEPDNGFIVTKGLNDPEVPPIQNMKGVVPVLQIRTKSMQGGDTVEFLAVRPIGKSVKFGKGIGKALLYYDKNNDGVINSGDIKLGESNKADGDYIIFEGLSVAYNEGEEKHFLIALDLNLKIGESVQIQIPRGRLKLDKNSTQEIVELPVTSKEFMYDCQEGDQDCFDFMDDSEGCKCSVVSVPENGTNFYIIFAMIFAAIFSVLKLSFKKED